MNDRAQPPADVDPRRVFWRRGSYQIAGDWIRPASVSLLDRLEQVAGGPLAGQRLLDVATGTGAVAIDAARRGAYVVGVDVTDELIEVARRRAHDTGLEVRFIIGDFDRLDDIFAGEEFDTVTSAFGVIFAPEPHLTLERLANHVRSDGFIAVTAWGPSSVFMVPATMAALFAEPPTMLDIARWATEIETMCSDTELELASSNVDEVRIPFASVEDCAEQLERWSGGWAQILETLDAQGVGDAARQRFVEHQTSFSVSTDDGIDIIARYHTHVLRRNRN